MITHVAIRAADGTVYALPKPNRHADLYAQFHQLRTERTGGLLVTRDGQTLGFLRDYGYDCPAGAPLILSAHGGHFLDRVQALAHVGAVKQQLTKHPGGVHDGQLYSEGVW